MINDISRFELGFEKCLDKAARAQTAEMECLWRSLADNYRWLLDLSQRERGCGSWQRNNADLFND